MAASLAHPRGRHRLLLAAGLAGWLVLGRDSEEPAGGDPGQGDSAVTEVTATTVLEVCDPVSDWTDLGVTGSTDVGQPGWHFAVTEGRQHEDGSGHWDVVLRIEATQDTNKREYNYAAFYHLVAGGDRHEPFCFADTGGENPINPGGSGEVLVGFDLPDELTGAFALDLDAAGESGRIELEPTG